MTQILSGELAFRLLKPNEAAFQGLSPLHREFLARDCLWAQNDETRRQQQLREVGRLSMTCHVKRLVDGALVRDSIDSAVQMQMRLLEGECSRLLRELRKTQEVSDAHLLHQLAHYFALVKDELLTARVKLTADSIECQVQKRQAKTLRDVRIFAHHLFHETRGKVLLSALPRDSAQFKRCKKAVRDNTSKLFMTEMAYQQIKVLAVLKLEHSLISEYLQQLATNMDTGKVKGLFCIVPKGSLHAFCTYGLHAKSNIATGGSQAQAKLPQAMRDVVGLQDLFQTQWFRTPSNAVAGERESNNYSAEALANEGVQHMNRHSETRGDQGDWPLLYFSRNCTLSQLRDLSKRDLEDGVFLALSRVLMSRLRTINSLITSQDVKDALKTDHDALYSSVNEEYVLLKPEYVLPEFIMLVHFVSSSSASNGAYKGASAWIPSALVPRGGRIAARGGDGKEQKVVESMGEMLMSNHLQPTLAAAAAAASGVTPADENDDDSAAPASERAAEKHALLVQLENSVAAVLAQQRILTRSAFQFVKGQRR